MGGAFARNMRDLLKSLQATDPQFIRCVKSNVGKKPKVYEGPLVLRQLRYACCRVCAAATSVGDGTLIQ